MMYGVFRIVEFRTNADAGRAIRDLHNSTLDGRVIFVREVGVSWFNIYELNSGLMFTLLLG